MQAAVVALSTLLAQCAPSVGQRTLTAIVRVESNANPLAMYDNTTRRSFAPRSLEDALITAQTLIDNGDSVDLGLAQINSANLARLRMNVRMAFDPCSNLRGAATILQSAYVEAAARFSPGPYALRRAIGAYNSGSIYGGDGYIDKILIAAGLPPQGDYRMPDLEPAPPPVAVVLPYGYAGTASAVAPPVRIAAPRVAARPKPVAPPAKPEPDPFGSAIMVVSAAAPVTDAMARSPVQSGPTLAVLSPNQPVAASVAQPAGATSGTQTQTSPIIVAAKLP